MTTIDRIKSLAGAKRADQGSAASPAENTVEDDQELPIPSDVNTVFLGGLFVLTLLAAFYVAAEIVLPIVLAFVLCLALTPGMRLLERVHVPRGVAAVFLILLLFATLAGLGTILSAPASSWAQKLPEGIPKLQERLSFLSRPIAAVQKLVDQAQGLTLGAESKAVPVAVQGSGLLEHLLSSTRTFASG